MGSCNNTHTHTCTHTHTYTRTPTFRSYVIVGCGLMGWGLLFMALRVAYIVGETFRISPLVDVCEITWASVLESDSAASLQLIEGLVDTLEQEADTQRALVSNSERENTPWSVLGVMRASMRQCMPCLRFESTLRVSYEPKVLPRHLLLGSHDGCHNIDGSDRDGYTRAMYHRATAQSLGSQRTYPQVDCLDQLYFQVPPPPHPNFTVHSNLELDARWREHLSLPCNTSLSTGRYIVTRCHNVQVTAL